MLVSRRGATRLAAAGSVLALSLALAPTSADLTGTSGITAADAGLSFAPRLVTVNADTLAARNAVIALGLDATEHAGHDFIEVVLHTPEDLAILEGAGFTYDVRIPDLIARQAERIELDAQFAAANPVTDLPSGRNSYRVLGDFGAEIDALVDEYPDTAKRISIGSSLEGRDLTGIEIGRNVNAPEDGRPVFLMFGAHHAREWPSAELPMEFAHDLLNGDTPGSRMGNLLDKARVIIVPVSNPDGYDASRTSGDLVDLRSVDGGDTASILATPGNAYKRKNCRYIDGVDTQPAGTCVLATSPGGNGIGVDLNRNYGGLWGGPGADAEAYSATYRGPAPFSEPETQAIRNLISTRQVTTLITNHTFSNLILRPVGVNPAETHPDGFPIGFSPDEFGPKGMKALGDAMATANGYSSQFGWQLYDTTGTTEDYSYNATGGYGYTFEIGPDEFHPPYAGVIDEYVGRGQYAGLGNREAYLLAFENAVDADTHSVITGSAPAGATITVSREGTFPLWDKSEFSDVVTTTMTVGANGQFEYHVNPSTRPFVASRSATVLSDAIYDASTSGTARAAQTVNYTLNIEEPVDIINAVVRATYEVPTPGLSTGQFHVKIYSPEGQLLSQGTEFGPRNGASWTDEALGHVPAGAYRISVNNAAFGAVAFDLTAGGYDVLADRTPGSVEAWTLTCDANGSTTTHEVIVDRGEAVNLGGVCA